MLSVHLQEKSAEKCSPFEADGGPPGTTFFSTLHRPRQSFEFAGLEESSVEQDMSILFAQRLNGVIRRGILCCVFYT